MARYIEVILTKRDVRCVAKWLDDVAPKTCEAVWQALPQEGNAFHAKYASHEIYALVLPFAETEPGLEHTTLTPIASDLLYFYLPPGTVYIPEVCDVADQTGVVDLAIFYSRDNFLFSPNVGPIPGNRFATITENLEVIAQAGDNIWREGFAGERLLFRRIG